LNVLQNRLKNSCSALNSDLYRANLIPNALCSCGKSDETAKHFLLHCENYIVQRNIFHTGIREINNDLSIDELTLLFGNEILNDEINTQIFLQVQKFVQDICRFKLARYRSLFNALHLFLNLLCKTFKYLSPDEK
jgi:hypothetical protein